MVPIMAVSTVMIAELAAAKVRSRKRRRSKSGEVARSSHQIQTASRATPPTHRPTMAPEDPAPVVALDDRQRETEEAGTDQGDAGPVEGGVGARCVKPAREREREDDAERPPGRLNQKTAGQPGYQTRTPPSTGPAAAASELGLRRDRRRNPGDLRGRPEAGERAPWAPRPQRRRPGSPARRPGRARSSPGRTVATRR